MIDVLVIADNHSAEKVILAALEPASYSVLELASDEITDDPELPKIPSVIVMHVADTATDSMTVMPRLREGGRTREIPLVLVADGEEAARRCRESNIDVAGYVDLRAAPSVMRAVLEASITGNGGKSARRDAESVSETLGGCLENHPAEVLVFDAEDRLVACNALIYNLYWPIAKQHCVGLHYSELLEALRESAIIDLRGRTQESWCKARLEGYAKRSITYDEYLNDGRALLVSHQRSDGVGTCILNFDITEITARQEGSRGREKRFKRLVEIGMALPSEKNYDHLFESILMEAKSICNADGGTIYLHDRIKSENGDEEAPTQECPALRYRHERHLGY